MLNNESKELAVFSSIMLLAVLVFSLVLFEITGIRIVLGVIFISLPFYLILSTFQIEEGEKFVFSILLGLTILPSLAYLLGFLMPFKIAIASAFALFMIIWLILRKYKPKK